ncbi:PREDICTED: uncharacterized protein C6orf203 homolog [Dinoponera quadriceps]|uniref:Uncharacterized protein C6orf203 homolog n=1 Tax=Dinoponera quadriceps TaxID=609295 RepID=A0A6P3X3X7_DINQU|nr:PREDICTED: uncharacterized protein C6orf203 homolog [Dinoponera quadriceps]
MLSRAAFNIFRRSLYNNARTLYCLQSNPTYDINAKPQDHCNLYVVKRFKSSKKKQNQNEEFSDEEEDIVEAEAPIGSKVLTISTQSIRLDTISKVGFSMSRSKIDEAFYASKIRLNGQKIFKKSKELDISDEVDLILHRSLDNSSLLVVNRIKILSMVPAVNGIKIKLSKDRNLLIEDYEEPWTSESPE